MRIAPLLLAALAACSSASTTTNTPPPPPPASNPLPVLTAASPAPVLAGAPAVTATVTGSNFIASSTVRWNGQALSTTFVSATQLTAQIPAADLATAGTGQLTVFTPAPGGGTSSALGYVVAGPAGLVVRDAVTNSVTWLAEANLPALNRFGLPACTATSTAVCVDSSGSMSYTSAVAWVAALNAAQYLGHTNWQLPTTPDSDATCPFSGPHNESFGFGCTGSALGSLFYNTLALKSPNTAVPITSSAVGPFINFQPYLYWSGSIPPDSTGRGTFSFSSGFQGSNTLPNYLYVLPMIQGKIPGTPTPVGNGLQINPGGQSVYDPVADVTWAQNANLAAQTPFSLPPCTKQGTPNLCVNSDGAMNWNSANQFIINMNSGAGYLNQKTWTLPSVNAACDTDFACAVAATTNPMGYLYYTQLGLHAGAPVVSTPAISVGGFTHLQPYLYWACEGATVVSPCQATGPVSGFEWSFSFGNGFQGTDVLKNDLFVMVYFVGP